MQTIPRMSPLIAAVSFALAVIVAAQDGSDPDLPDGVQQIIPRGAIPAILHPEFVTADS